METTIKAVDSPALLNRANLFRALECCFPVSISLPLFYMSDAQEFIQAIYRVLFSFSEQLFLKGGK